MQKINEHYELAITHPEEAAGAANVPVMKLLDSLDVEHVSLSMSLADRILTNGETVKDASTYIREHGGSTYIKGPGITPRDDQTLDMVIELEKAEKLIFKDDTLQEKAEKFRNEIQPNASEEKMVQFAYEIAGVHVERIEYRGETLERKEGIIDRIGSPNAVWRMDLAATLVRGVSGELSDRSTAEVVEWSSDTPLKTHATKAVEGENMFTATTEKGGNLQIVFESESGTKNVGEMSVSSETPVRLFTMNRDAVVEEIGKALDDNPDSKIVHGAKQTVLNVVDNALLEDIQKALEAKGRVNDIADFARETDSAGKISLDSTMLIDNLFAILSNKAPEENLTVISPNHSYSDYVGIWDLIKEKGGFNPPENSEIVRASGTKDHYKAVQYMAEENGTISIQDSDGNILASGHLDKNDVTMATNFDREKVALLIDQMLDNAQTSGKNNVLLGFGGDDDYYGVAINELNARKEQYPELNIKIMTPVEATAEYFAGGVKDTTLVLGNINGDFATDIELSGKGTSYSKAILYDGRVGVELGTGGTAPDLMNVWKETGQLLFNPMAFVDGMSIALESSANLMKKNGDDEALVLEVSKAIESGMYATTDKGIVPPIVAGKFTTTEDVEDFTKVSTHTFVKSIELETIKILEGKHPNATEDNINTIQNDLDKLLAKDKAIAEALENHKDEWKNANTEYNNARSNLGKINPLEPDYTIPLPEQIDYSKLNGDTFLALQEARVKLMTSTEKEDIASAKQELGETLGNLGVQENMANEIIRSETCSHTFENRKGIKR